MDETVRHGVAMEVHQAPIPLLPQRPQPRAGWQLADDGKARAGAAAQVQIVPRRDLEGAEVVRRQRGIQVLEARHRKGRAGVLLAAGGDVVMADHLLDGRIGGEDGARQRLHRLELRFRIGLPPHDPATVLMRGDHHLRLRQHAAEAGAGPA
nr:hypothetical protein [Roseomonas oleicola]